MALPDFTASILDRILANNGVDPPGYDESADGPLLQDWRINGTNFGLTFMEVQSGRLDDHVPGGPLQSLEDFWNVQPGGEGESELNWLVARYSSVPAENQFSWVRDVAPLFSMIERDAATGLSYRASGANGYTNKNNLKNWVDELTLALGGTVP